MQIQQGYNRKSLETHHKPGALSTIQTLYHTTRLDMGGTQPIPCVLYHQKSSREEVILKRSVLVKSENDPVRREHSTESTGLCRDERQEYEKPQW